jgi:two-component system, chemotaxis family, chemotaxis protein CheY
MADILTVDDSASIRQAIKIALRSEGHEIHEATDGREGLRLADERTFDLILVDLNMPEMDGMTMIRELRKKPAHAGVPVLFLTSESDTDVKQQAKTAGATGWLTKPFEASQLIKIVNKVLAK